MKENRTKVIRARLSEEEKEQVEKLLTENMESAYELAVKLKADLNEGESWYELK